MKVIQVHDETAHTTAQLLLPAGQTENQLTGCMACRTGPTVDGVMLRLLIIVLRRLRLLLHNGSLQSNIILQNLTISGNNYKHKFAHYHVFRHPFWICKCSQDKSEMLLSSPCHATVKHPLSTHHFRPNRHHHPISLIQAISNAPDHQVHRFQPPPNSAQFLVSFDALLDQN